MKSFSLAAIALVAPVQAGLRFPCSSLTIQRLDPVVESGASPSAHLHHIVGGNAFNASMSGDVGSRGSCTTCQMSQDFSNYWTAVMFFKHPTNGSYKRVPVIKNAALAAGTQGGITVYYTQYDLTNDNTAKYSTTAFQKGFRMTVGTPTATKQQTGLTYQCLTGSQANPNREFPEKYDFPDKQCSAGIFTTHHFPRCWDGKNLDSPNHQDHMYNTIKTDGFMDAEGCPSTHPVRMPQVTYETVWDTTGFNSLWKTGDPNPFVWSFGANPHGTHADYMFGWKDDSLQKAMNKSNCYYDGCGAITKQDMTVANKCTVKDFVGEKLDGWLPYLPGQGAMIFK